MSNNKYLQHYKIKLFPIKQNVKNGPLNVTIGKTV